MILRPLQSAIDPAIGGDATEPAWAVISRTQNLDAPQYLLIGQPDHARLSGELAAMFRAPFLPSIDAAIVKAIAVHDNGWAGFAFERDLQGEPPLTDNGRPQHFMQVTLGEALMAWTGSIKAAGEVSPLSEFMVSGHFSRIGAMRVQMEVDSPEDLARLQGFVRDEEEAQKKLGKQIGMPAERLTEYVDLLQFCDLLSLYLCCGTAEAAQFPQQFGGTQVTARYVGGVLVTTPSVFQGTTQRFYLPARIYPSTAGEAISRISFDLR